eukprot:3937797-Rhodomonas_salina.3
MHARSGMPDPDMECRALAGPTSTKFMFEYADVSQVVSSPRSPWLEARCVQCPRADAACDTLRRSTER